MGKKRSIVNQYYLTEIDTSDVSIYCNCQPIGEKFILSHSHHKSQFLYTEGGIVYVKFLDRTVFLPARHYIWIPSDVEHSIHPNSPDVIMRNIYFPFTEKEPDVMKEINVFPADDLIIQMILFLENWDGDVFPNDQFRYQFLEGFKALLTFIQPREFSFTLPNPTDEKLFEIINYLENNMEFGIFFKDLAKKFGYSERNLNRKFKAEFGMPFIQYYIQMRIYKAMELLITKNYTVSEVAILSGYNSIPSFSNSFFALTGMRPSEFANLKSVL